MAAPPVPLGQHLYNDIAHDFGREVAKGLKYSTGNDDGYRGEADTTTSLLAAIEAAVGPQFTARKNNQAIFTIPETTSTFSTWTPLRLHPTGNDKLGIIQDAGEFITLQVGSKNVITFGSILDPAPKPIAPERQPIWYDPGGAPPLRIGLEQFGFNPAVIRAVEIGSLTAGGVTVGFELPDNTKIDAISMQLGESIKLKEIN
jgi:hypothetical protein